MEKDIEILIELCSSEVSLPEVKTLHFPSLPSTFRQIKERIEACCSIPVCVQTLFYQSVEVTDVCSLSSLYMRSGDTVKVTFPEHGECEKVIQSVQWLHQIIPVLKEFKKAKTDTEVNMLYNNYKLILNNMEIYTILTCKLFCPWSEKTKQVNCSQFMFLGGVKLLVTFHKLVIELRRNECSGRLRYLTTLFERICCQAITNFAMDFTCRRHILERGGLQQCIRSFLIKPADDESLHFNYSHDIVGMAAYAICNISELPEVQHLLSKKPDMIQQALLVGKCSSFTCKVAEIAIVILQNLAQSPASHANLLKPGIFDKLIKVCAMRRDEQALSGDSIIEVMALECNAAAFMGLMICDSPHLLQTFPMESLENSVTLMDKILCYDPEEIRAHQIKEEFVCRTFEPCVLFLYSPHFDTFPSSFGVMIAKLHNRATEVLLHYFEYSIGRQDHIDILVEEKLLDFVVALPWIVPQECQERARKVCKEMAKFLQVQPPSLTSLVMAKLAKMKWGLRKMREMVSVSQLLISMP